jgi:hypothetical protein
MSLMSKIPVDRGDVDAGADRVRVPRTPPSTKSAVGALAYRALA